MEGLLVKRFLSKKHNVFLFCSGVVTEQNTVTLTCCVCAAGWGTSSAETKVELNRSEVQGRVARAAGDHGVGQQHGVAAKRTAAMLLGVRV